MAYRFTIPDDLFDEMVSIAMRQGVTLPEVLHTILRAGLLVVRASTRGQGRCVLLQGEKTTEIRITWGEEQGCEQIPYQGC